jgi:hypothetical protein
VRALGPCFELKVRNVARDAVWSGLMEVNTKAQRLATVIGVRVTRVGIVNRKYPTARGVSALHLLFCREYLQVGSKYRRSYG